MVSANTANSAESGESEESEISEESEGKNIEYRTRNKPACRPAGNDEIFYGCIGRYCRIMAWNDWLEKVIRAFVAL